MPGQFVRAVPGSSLTAADMSFSTKSFSTKLKTAARSKVAPVDSRALSKAKDAKQASSTSLKAGADAKVPSQAKVGWGKIKIDVVAKGAMSGADGSPNLLALAKASKYQQELRKAEEERQKYLREHAVDQLSDFQIEEFRDAFRVFDSDGSGNIDKQELKRLMASVGQIPDDDELNEMVRIADADGSGEVDFYEFVALMAHKMADPSNTEAVSAAFQLFDNDGDGKLNATELRNIMMNVGEPATWEDINALLNQVDVNSDGVIDLAEFTQMVLQEQMQAAEKNLGVDEKKRKKKEEKGKNEKEKKEKGKRGKSPKPERSKEKPSQKAESSTSASQKVK